MKARRLRTLLERELGYVTVRSTGSHRTMRAPGWPQLVFAFHDGDTVGGHLVRNVLVKQVGLSDDEAREVVRGA
ncbi:type II toxin-antitoxin system HicA family toxin [Cellulomonas sp.]|uniref:type II toxin-antitoxin system HicA family toxin n=1 Tax=Cellulomonas sp. TaxID=40001 RepID=UPI002D59D3F6|nr:type II toxin-antitoxin system HicA family toxin [Cellulomonas sp.]HYQ76150.1 type II toxin-antitoxin system HicA family toxin [Cellulomonas sp.]